MGMFDTLMIEIMVILSSYKTKHFDKVLGNYYLGDNIAGAPSGVSVYYDLIGMDDNG